MKTLILLTILLLIVGCSEKVVYVRDVPVTPVDNFKTIRDDGFIRDIKITTYFHAENPVIFNQHGFKRFMDNYYSKYENWDSKLAVYIIQPCSTVTETTACYEQKECDR